MTEPPPRSREQMIDEYVSGVEAEVPGMNLMDRLQVQANAEALADHVLASRNA